MRDWHIHFPSNFKAIRMNGSSGGYSNLNTNNDENGHLNGDADYLRDLESTAAASSSSNSRGIGNGIGLHDLSKEATNAQDYDLPMNSAGSSTASRRGSLPNSPHNNQSMSLNPNSAADQSSAGTTSSHSPRMAAAASRGPSPAGHANPFLSAPPLNRSTSKEGDKNSQ